VNEPVPTNRWLLPGILGLSLTARLAQYVFNRSLWLDEAFLTFNILERDFGAFLQPLSDNQVAPPGFLCVERLFVLIWGSSEYALRALPLIGGLAAVFLFYVVARVHLGSKSALIAAALLGWSQPLIYYASEVKPYSTDALLTIVIYALCLPFIMRRCTFPSWRQTMVIGLVGALSMWFSYPVVFVLGSVGAAMLAGALLQHREQSHSFGQLFRLMVIFIFWGLSLAALYLVILRTNLANEFLRTFWGGFFASFPPRSLAEVYWFAQLFFDFLVHSGGMPFYGLATFAWLAGAADLWKSRQWQVVLALMLPLGLAMVAATLHRYPFYGRTLLFAVPPTFLLVAQGAWAAYRSLVKDSRVIALILIGALLFHPLYRTIIVFVQPLTTEELKPVLQYMRDHWQAGDRIYVYHAAARPFAYYAPRYGFDDPLLYQLGRSSDGNMSILVEDIEAMRSARTWFVFVHVYSYGGISEDAFMLGHLDRTWPRLDVFKAPGAAVYLYDMR